MDIYERLGLPTGINAFGTITEIGGSLMPSEVVDAMREAASHFVDMRALRKAAGAYIARLTGADACCITCGAAAGLVISVAACMVRMDEAARLRLPDARGLKNEVLLLKCHSNSYGQTMRLSGAQLIEIGTASHALLSEVEAAITERTAAFFYSYEAAALRGSLPLTDVAALMKKHHIPIIVDAAAELPPKSNLTRFLSEGADLVVFSGGKELRGPQASGLILGDRRFIEACEACSCPNAGVGRSMKVDKESIAGIVKAVELFMAKDLKRQDEQWADMARTIALAVEGLGTAGVKIDFPSEPNIQPMGIPRVYVTPTAKGSQAVYDALLSMRPQIFTYHDHGQIILNPQCLKEEEIPIVIRALTKALSPDASS